MNDPATTAFLTTREVAALLRVRERKVYELAAAGEIPHRRVTGKLLFPRAALDSWLSGTVSAARSTNVIAGSHDPLLDWAIRESGSGLASLFDGSFDGLSHLTEGRAVAAGLHLRDPDGGWNLTAAEAQLGGRGCVLVGWAVRQRGLLISRKSTLGKLGDLPGCRVVQRQPAAGAGHLLRELLREAEIAEKSIIWTSDLARTETDAAAMVATGQADAALGLLSMARQFDLGFVPLVSEHFDLACDRRAWFEPPLQRLFTFAREPAFAAKAKALGGYDITPLGTVRWNA